MSAVKYLRKRGVIQDILPFFVSLTVGLILGLSAKNYKSNPLLPGSSTSEAVQKAAAMGDYASARWMWEVLPEAKTNVLGSQSELYNQVYPEYRAESAINKYENWLQRFPGHRDILWQQAQLLTQLGRTVEAEDKAAQAQVLDPNNPRLRN